MYRQHRNRYSRAVMGSVFAGSVVIAALMHTSFAQAQTSSYQAATDNVFINWGALNGSGQTTAAAPVTAMPYMPASRDGLLMPDATMPRSQLHVAVPGGSSSQGVTLRKPGSPAKAAAMPATPKPVAKRPAAPAESAPKKLAEKKPTPAPKPAAVPAPPPPPPAKTASAPPPPPAPAPAPAAAVAAAPPPPPMPVEPETAAAAPEKPEAPAPTEQASTSTATPADGPVKVVFNNDDTKLSADGQSALESVVEELAKSENSRVQLMAYAAGEDLTSSKARRISLSRALSVRSYLIEKGVRSTRIDVRALGDKGEGEPRNRVDVNMVER